MSTPPTPLPLHVLSARELDDVLQAVKVLQDWNTLEAIPYLVRYDRKAAGWLFTLISWLATLATSLLVMACLLALLTGLWAVGITVLVALANGVKPGWGNWTALIAVVTVMLVLFHDKRFTEVAGQRLRFPSTNLIWPLRFDLWCAKVLSYLMIAMVAGGMLAVALSPLILACFDLGIRLSEQQRELDKIIIHVRDTRPWILTGTSVTLVAGLAYRGKLAFALAQPVTVPFQWLYASADLLTKRIQLRVSLAEAIRIHRRRNAEAIGGDWCTAVCTECLARFEQCSAPISYGRRLRYAWCRHCHSDLHCFTGVRKIEGRLDRGLNVAQVQVRDILRIDLLTRLESNAPNMPPDLDEIVIADADDEDVERFIVAYKEKELRIGITPLEHLNCRIEPGARVAEITLRNLHEAFRHIEILG